MLSRFVVGIQIGITSGCAIYENGKIVFAASEERYSRIKNDTSFPRLCIKDAISIFGLNKDNIEKVILVSKNMTPNHFLINRESSFGVADYLFEQDEYYKATLLENSPKNYLELFKDRVDDRYLDLFQKVALKPDLSNEIWNEWRICETSKILNVSHSKIEIVDHEAAHAAYAYYGSHFRSSDTLIVTFDGFGDRANATVSSISGNQINFLKLYSNFNIGRIYRYITLLLSMKPSEHEFKVMGLAPYASDYTCRSALNVFRKAYQFNLDGSITSDPDLKDHFFYFVERLRSCRFDGIAGALQTFTEEMVVDLIRYWVRRTGATRVVVSGGVSLNIKANMEIGKIPEIQDLFVVGSGGDESLCIAGIFAYLDMVGRGQEIKPLEHMYLGNDLNDNDIDAALEDLASRGFQIVRDVKDCDVAHRLASGDILGRVSGKMEFGARALGNRSILADPRSSETIKKINSKIKNRDFWMPFTPSIIAPAASEYLYNPKEFRFPYMSIACETTEKARKELPAALHPADFTARPQVVDEKINPKYYSLIYEFQKITGVGALLNTSLNLHGLPIVRTIGDAVHVLDNSQLDGLIIDQNLVLRDARC